MVVRTLIPRFSSKETKTLPLLFNCQISEQSVKYVQSLKWNIKPISTLITLKNDNNFQFIFK